MPCTVDEASERDGHVSGRVAVSYNQLFARLGLSRHLILLCRLRLEL